jgi:hypothetical protein
MHYSEDRPKRNWFPPETNRELRELSGRQVQIETVEFIDNPIGEPVGVKVERQPGFFYYH